jgi:hypothetical protein
MDPTAMPRYIATLRATYDAEDEVEAIFIADQIRLNGEQDLDTDEDLLDEGEEVDTLEVTQITDNGLNLTPDEALSVFRHARNLLIKTRIKQCFDLAREFDRTIYALENREIEGFSMRSYDYGRFMDLAESILIKGEVPNG